MSSEINFCALSTIFDTEQPQILNNPYMKNIFPLVLLLLPEENCGVGRSNAPPVDYARLNRQKLLRSSLLLF